MLFVLHPYATDPSNLPRKHGLRRVAAPARLAGGRSQGTADANGRSSPGTHPPPAAPAQVDPTTSDTCAACSRTCAAMPPSIPGASTRLGSRTAASWRTGGPALRTETCAPSSASPAPRRDLTIRRAPRRTGLGAGGARRWRREGAVRGRMEPARPLSGRSRDHRAVARTGRLRCDRADRSREPAAVLRAAAGGLLRLPVHGGGALDGGRRRPPAAQPAAVVGADH